jgi:hypothetical protein
MSSVALMPNPEPARPVDWDRELAGAKMLLKSGLLPAAIKTPETAMFIILAGRDLGLSPVQSLRSIHVIQGKVEVAADQQLGLFHRAGGKSRWEALTNERAVLILTAPWLSAPHTESFTLEDAKRAKLGGDNWQKYPKAMLRSRAITAGLKSVGFDPTAGVYDYGEIGGEEPQLTDISGPVEAAEAEAIQDASPSDIDEMNREKEAVSELTELIASDRLTTDQKIYIREKLGDGADPVSLLNATKIRLQNQERAKA